MITVTSTGISDRGTVMARLSQLCAIAVRPRPAQHRPVGAGQHREPVLPQPDGDQQHRARRPATQDAAMPVPNSVMQDDRGGGQDEQLGHREDHVAGELDAAAHQPDGAWSNTR